MSNKIYRYEWKGAKTGWDYRMDVIRAAGTPLLSPEVIYIPEGAFEIKKRNIKYNKYPYGALSSQMTVFWDLDVIPDNAEYSDLLDALLSPRVELPRVFCTYKDFTAGTIYRYYIKFNGNDSSPQYREVFTGIQKHGIEKGYTFETNQLETLVVHSMIYGLNNVLFDRIYLLLNNDPQLHTARYSAVEYVVDFPESVKLFIGHYLAKPAYMFPDLKYMWFFKLQEIWDYIDSALTEIMTYLLRETPVVTIGQPYPQYYKQTYNRGGALGGQLAFNQLYIIGAIADTETIDGNTRLEDGLFIPWSQDYIGVDGRNAWDFFSDFFSDSFFKMGLDTDSMWFAPLFNSDNTLELIREDLNKVNVKFEKDVANTVTASIIESPIGGDIPKYEVNSGEGRNTGGETLPIVFNNMPVSDYYKSTVFNIFNAAGEYLSYYFNIPHLWNLWYFDASIFQYGQAWPVRVHEHIRTPYAPDGLGGHLYIDELPDCEFKAFLWEPTQAAGSVIEEFFLEMQLESCKPRVQAKAFFALFGDKKLTHLVIEVDYNVLTQFGSLQPGFVWDMDGFSQEFEFDLSLENSHIKDIPVKWFMISTELNDIDETAKVLLMPRIA